MTAAAPRTELAPQAAPIPVDTFDADDLGERIESTIHALNTLFDERAFATELDDEDDD